MSKEKSLESVYSNYLESKLLHSKKSLKDTSLLRKYRREIAKLKTKNASARLKEVKNG